MLLTTSTFSERTGISKQQIRDLVYLRGIKAQKEGTKVMIEESEAKKVRAFPRNVRGVMLPPVLRYCTRCQAGLYSPDFATCTPCEKP